MRRNATTRFPSDVCYLLKAAVHNAMFLKVLALRNPRYGSVGRRQHPMAAMRYDDPDERIRDLCQRVLEEKDPSKVQELLDSLQATVQGYQDDTRTRMRYIANYYRDRLRKDSPSGNSRSNHAGSERALRIRALLEFLGLGRGPRPEGEVEG
jgi:hypothetical protein